ncbi:MAG: hypothetical protein M3347_12710, partial [Armatimonadota bacterium]|nr:hypothetical protein [Armatimonadota bacterium]
MMENYSLSSNQLAPPSSLLQSGTLLGRRRTATWFSMAWVRTTFVIFAVLSVIIPLWCGAGLEVLCGHVALLASFYLSLAVLSDRRLLNPIQAGAFLFYWWFGVGPLVIAGWANLIGDTWINGRGFLDGAAILETGIESVWIVALGLPLYAIVARCTLDWLATQKVVAAFLMPEEQVYKPRTVLTYILVGLLVLGILQIVGSTGMGGVEDANYLGGRITTVWWVGVLSSISGISVFAVVGVIGYLNAPSDTRA